MFLTDHSLQIDEYVVWKEAVHVEDGGGLLSSMPAWCGVSFIVNYGVRV